jgi:hypothetical protein
MNLDEHVDGILHRFLLAAEAGGEEARALAERLYAPLDAAIRLAMQDVLVAAAEEISCDLAPGSLEVRLRGRQPEFVVNLAPAEPGPAGDEPLPAAVVGEGDDGAMSRINLRLPDHLKARVEQAAAREGVSANSWLVRAVAVVLERSEVPAIRTRRQAPGTQRLTGWAR